MPRPACFRQHTPHQEDDPQPGKHQARWKQHLIGIDLIGKRNTLRMCKRLFAGRDQNCTGQHSHYETCFAKSDYMLAAKCLIVAVMCQAAGWDSAGGAFELERPDANPGLQLSL